MVIGDELWCTGALVVGVVEVAARAGIHGGEQHKVGGIGGLAAGATDVNHVVFERLAQRFKSVLAKLGHFVEEEHTVVGERYLARH